jgi:3'-5' exonuclease
MTDHIVVWDLETVPDLLGYARANGLEDKDPEFMRKAIGDAFPKLIYHSIVCIGAVIAKFDGEHWATVAVGAPHVGDRSEKELITAFVDKLDALRPQLISFNGNAFDLPVLRYRAMISEVSAPALSKRAYFNRYTSDSLDLCDVLAALNSMPWRRFWDLRENQLMWTARRLKNTSMQDVSPTSPATVKAMSLTHTAFGYAMNSSEERSLRKDTRRANPRYLLFANRRLSRKASLSSKRRALAPWNSLNPPTCERREQVTRNQPRKGLAKARLNSRFS